MSQCLKDTKFFRCDHMVALPPLSRYMVPDLWFQSEFSARRIFSGAGFHEILVLLNPEKKGEGAVTVSCWRQITPLPFNQALAEMPGEGLKRVVPWHALEGLFAARDDLVGNILPQNGTRILFYISGTKKDRAGNGAPIESSPVPRLVSLQWDRSGSRSMWNIRPVADPASTDPCPIETLFLATGVKDS